MSMILAATVKVVFTLTVTLSSAPTEPKYYQFDTSAECEQVRPFVTELYLNLGENEVNTKCDRTIVTDSGLLPLNVRMIM